MQNMILNRKCAVEIGLEFHKITLAICFTLLVFSPKLFAQSQVSTETIEDFEEPNISSFDVYSDRGCQLQLTSKYFVVSGKQAAELDVTNQNIDPMHPPCFYIYPVTTNWSGFGSLVIHLAALPADLSSEAKILVQLQSSNRQGNSSSPQLQTYWFSVPANQPITVTLPIGDVAFKGNVGSIAFGAASDPGSYFIDNIQVTTDTTKATVVGNAVLPPGVQLPLNICADLSQQESFYSDSSNTLYCYSSLPLNVDLKPTPLEEKFSVQVSCTDNHGDSLLQTQVVFNKGDTMKTVQMNASGQTELNLDVGGTTKRFAIKDLESIREQNNASASGVLQNRTIFSSAQRMVVSYDGMGYDPDGKPKIEEMISRLRDLGIKCYAYLIYTHSKEELALLPQFCDLAAKAGIEVWVTLVPPSELSPLDSGTQEGAQYPPYGTDYVKWAKEISSISKSHPNLSMWIIDDFSNNLNYFTPTYTKEIFAASKQETPDLLFGATIYHDALEKLDIASYSPYVEAVNWGYQNEASLYPDCGVSATSLPIEINDYWKDFPSAVLIPCIYFTPHSSWPEGRPTVPYLEDALKIAYQDAGVVFVYLTPDVGTTNYGMVKAFCDSVYSK